MEIVTAKVPRLFALLMVISPLWSVLGEAAEVPPDQVVKQTTQKLLTALKAEKEAIESDPERIYQLVQRIVLPHVDMRRMSALVLGKHWRTLNGEQRARFTREFQVLLLRTYGRTLVHYTDQKVTYLPSKPRSSQQSHVERIEIQQRGIPPVQISFSMHLAEKQWLVYDFKVEGVSLVSNYRSTFSSIIRRSGIDGLFEHLVAHNRKPKENS